MSGYKYRTPKVKQIVARLNTEARTEADTHRKIYRLWGSYDSVDAGDRFEVKHIVVKRGADLSVHMHHRRAEHWIVVFGTLG